MAANKHQLETLVASGVFAAPKKGPFLCSWAHAGGAQDWAQWKRKNWKYTEKKMQNHLRDHIRVLVDACYTTMFKRVQNKQFRAKNANIHDSQDCWIWSTNPSLPPQDGCRQRWSNQSQRIGKCPWETNLENLLERVPFMDIWMGIWGATTFSPNAH